MPWVGSVLLRRAALAAFLVTGGFVAAAATTVHASPSPSAAAATQAPASSDTPSPAPAADHADAEAFCPLSQAATAKAMAAFRPLATVFTTEPRCVNCHGGIDPFSTDADTTHAGGHYSAVMKVGKAGSTNQDDVDVANTFKVCQGCHSGLPGWREAPRSLFFAGKDAPTLCEQEKRTFADPSGFLGHIDNENGGIQFIATGLAGTRGLNDFIKGLMAKAGTPYRPEPAAISKAELYQEASAWVEALDLKFVGGPSCGCKPIRYAIRVTIKEQYDLKSAIGHYAADQTGDIPLTIGDAGEVTGTATLPRAIEAMTFHSKDASATCNLGRTPQPATWTIEGKLDDPDKPTTLTANLHWTLAPASIAVACQTRDGTFNVGLPLPGLDSRSRTAASPFDALVFHTQVGDVEPLNWTDGNGFDVQGTFTLVQLP